MNDLNITKQTHIDLITELQKAGTFKTISKDGWAKKDSSIHKALAAIVGFYEFLRKPDENGEITANNIVIAEIVAAINNDLNAAQVRGKLTNNGTFDKDAKTAASGRARETKGSMVRGLVSMLETLSGAAIPHSEALDSLDKANSGALKVVGDQLNIIAKRLELASEQDPEVEDPATQA